MNNLVDTSFVGQSTQEDLGSPLQQDTTDTKKVKDAIEVSIARNSLMGDPHLHSSEDFSGDSGESNAQPANPTGIPLSPSLN
ncbi:hypothetical protein K2173_022188 [Erythroxylum novogranatense]|uniref:Uncharacterized protein n=1 Tax=Erythroxylum novogranatense TaxID=1862640 RepID=A0AAV8TY64_9ROSI|nr:hypothetical protein K2173_022188 [Erythroxylum novogranatense]